MGCRCGHRVPNTNNALITVRVRSLVLLELSTAHVLLVSTMRNWVLLRAHQE